MGRCSESVGFLTAVITARIKREPLLPLEKTVKNIYFGLKLFLDARIFARVIICCTFSVEFIVFKIRKTVVLVCTLISIVQGFVLTLLLIKYFVTSKQEILGYLLTSPLLLSISYYVFIISGISNVVYLLKTKRSSTVELDDKNLFQHVTQLFGAQNIKLKLFGGKQSFNAFIIPISVMNREYVRVFIGKDLLNEANLAEILFVIGHELSHLRDRHGLKKMLAISIYFIALLSVGIVANYLATIYSGFSGYLAINLLLIPFGIMGLNAIQWYFEYRADILSYQITRDLDSAIRLLEKIKNSHTKSKIYFSNCLPTPIQARKEELRDSEKFRNISFNGVILKMKQSFLV